MRRGSRNTRRDLVLGASVLAILAWCLRNPSQGLPVLIALVSVPLVAVFVKAGVEGALILLDDRWDRGRER
jgi:hypothetical protein